MPAIIQPTESAYCLDSETFSSSLSGERVGAREVDSCQNTWNRFQFPGQ